jgi:hypothetical protein
MKTTHQMKNGISDDSLINIPEEAILVIGAGKFGSRAIKLLSRRKNSHIIVVDGDREALSDLRGQITHCILCDGITFLYKNFQRLKPTNVIVPALPIHLAFRLLECLIQDTQEAKTISVPEELVSFLPYHWAGNDHTLLVSYANFLCPDNCPEPEDHCTVTGKPRSVPLYKLFEALQVREYCVGVIRSRQLAPGLGGYEVSRISDLADKIKKSAPSKWLIGTACKCHGVLNAMEIKKSK